MTDGADHWLTVAEAAALEGVAERTMRRRLSGMSPADVRHRPARVRRAALRPEAPEHDSSPPEVSGQSPAESGGSPALTSDRLAELVAEVAWLRAQLDDANRARAEERRLYLAVLQALPAGPVVATHNDADGPAGPEPQDAAEAPETATRRPWWPWRKTR